MSPRPQGTHTRTTREVKHTAFFLLYALAVLAKAAILVFPHAWIV